MEGMTVGEEVTGASVGIIAGLDEGAIEGTEEGV
jgi:hypothetical protein